MPERTSSSAHQVLLETLTSKYSKILSIKEMSEVSGGAKMGSESGVTRAMHRDLKNALLLTITLLPSIPCWAQGAQQGPDLKLNPMAALRQFEPSANQEYELGRGDEISIDFAGRPELSSKRIVGPDGRVTLPLAGAVELTEKTREQAARAIEAAMQPFYASVSVTVGVDKYTSNHVLLLGYVDHPGVVSFAQPPTLLEVLTHGGSVTEFAGAPQGAVGAGGQGSSRALPAIPERVAIYRGSSTVMWVEVKSLLDSGSPLADLRLKRDDIVYVPSPHDNYVSVMGQVQHPGAFPLRSTTSLTELLAEAGGPAPQAGRNPEIQVIQPSTGKTRNIPFQTLLLPGTLDLTLHAGDVVYVPQTGLNRVGFVLQQLSPLLSVFTTAALVGR